MSSFEIKKSFLCGVIEGFYGCPWTHEERLELFQRMHQMKMNSYLYAPKDDLKHRQKWRDPYTKTECDRLQQLIKKAKENDVEFIYGISPGLDMKFSRAEELDLLKLKLDQLNGIDCQSFALLFDDIDIVLCEEDKIEFESAAVAQIHVTNTCYSHLGSIKRFLFCPTEYCTRLAFPSILKSKYLKTIGRLLHSEIDILWTGPKVISRDIPLNHLQDLQSILNRPLVIWDNLHANDYDMRRIFLGPFKGRSSEIRRVLRGVMTNPNCQFQLNFIPMHSLAQWDKLSSCEDEMREYNPQDVLKHSLEAWLKDIYEENSHLNETDLSTSVDECSTMKIDAINIGDTAISVGSTNIPERLQLEDLQLLVDFYYLPYEYGPLGQDVLNTARWIVFYASKLKSRGKKLRNEWLHRVDYFHKKVKHFQQICDRLNGIPKRSVCYQLYPYVWDLRGALNILDTFFLWLKDATANKKPGFLQTDPEPSAFRGGIAADLLRLLPIDPVLDHFPLSEIPDSENGLKLDISGGVAEEEVSNLIVTPLERCLIPIMLIRPYYKQSCSDKETLYKLCSKMSCWHALSNSREFNGSSQKRHEKILEMNTLIDNAALKDLAGDRYVGAFLELSTNNTIFVIEDDKGEMCGYAIAVEKGESAWKHVQRKYAPTMRQKYPLSKTEKKGSSSTCAPSESIEDPLTKRLCEDMVSWFHSRVFEMNESSGNNSSVGTSLCVSSKNTMTTIFRDYPALVVLDYLPSYNEYDWNNDIVAQRLSTCLLSSIKTNNIHGAHCCIWRHDYNRLLQYKRMGFKEITTYEEENDMMFLGRLL